MNAGIPSKPNKWSNRPDHIRTPVTRSRRWESRHASIAMLQLQE